MTLKRLIPATIVSINLLLFFMFCGISIASNLADADVVEVNAVDHGSKGWSFHVTVLHPDTGWEDYCNGWDIVTDRGEVLKNIQTDKFTRLLYHPHESEQPFTRSVSRLKIPDGTKTLTVRAHDIVDGFGGKEIIIDLSNDNGANYQIKRN